MSVKHRTPRFLVALLVATAAAPACAVQVDWLLTLGVEHNDNINLSETDPVSGNILIPGVGFSLTQQGSRVQANVNGIVEYRDYLNGAFADATRAELNGTVNWRLIPQRMDWTFQDSLGSEPIDEFAVDSPGNRQQINVFSTGPNVYFGLGKPLHGQLEARYINSYAETTDQFNSDRFASAVRLFKDLDPTRQLSANVEAQRVKFDKSGAGPDYTRYNAYAGYHAQRSHLTLDLAAGYTKMDFSGHYENASGPLLRAGVAWQASARSSFTATLSHQYTDAAGDLLDTPATGGEPTTDIRTGNLGITAQSYLDKSIALGYAFNSTRIDFGLAPYYSRLDYDNAPDLDRRDSGLVATLTWRLRPLWSASFTAGGNNEQYRNLDRRDRNRTYTAGLAWQMSRRMSWHLDLSHNTRRSTVIGQNADQNIVYLWVAFSR